MGKIAFVFSGQGDQYPGMGKEFCKNYRCAAEVFQMCDTLRSGTSQQCFYGSEEELRETKNTQPCLFATELAAADILLEAGIRPDAVAGFSLGGRHRGGAVRPADRLPTGLPPGGADAGSGRAAGHRHGGGGEADAGTGHGAVRKL